MRLRLTLTALVSVIALVGCSSSGSESTSGQSDSRESSSPSASPTAATAPADISPQDFADEAKEIVDSFSEEELAGSLIIGTWAGTDTQTGVNLVTKNHLGGVIVMKDNLPENPAPDQVKGVTEAVSMSRDDKQPVSIGVDQEGGPVSRLSTAALPFPPMMALSATGDLGLAKTATTTQARDLTDLGFTIDFAPDSDVTIGPKDVTINVRSAGDEPDQVAEVVSSAVEGYWGGGIASSAKHFPGHGRLTTDSHEGLPVSKKSIKELEKSDLVPFKSAVKAGVPMVMMGHIGLPDAKSTPATLNKNAYKAIRSTLDFDGVIITDALNMQAVPQNLGGGETVKALKAGADLALMPPDAGAAQAAVVEALQNGDLTKKDLVEKSRRVVAMQLATAEVQKALGGGAKESGGESGAEKPESVLTEVAEKSVTVLKGECEFAGTDSISIVGGSETEKAALGKAAEDEGLSVGSSGTTVSLSPGTTAEVAVGTAAPWTMSDTPAKTAVTAYDDNEFAMKAVAKWLKGDLTASGKLPVEYSGSDKAPKCG